MPAPPGGAILLPGQSIDLLGLRATAPSVPSGFLERPRLVARLTAAATHPLTVVCAGPGHGKTLTLASWAQRRANGKVAWLTLDDTDNAPQAFWSDVLGTLILAGCVPLGNPLRELRPAARFDGRAADLLAAGFATLTEPVVLVLDDFQAITDDGVLRSVGRLLDLQPPPLRIILATRSDPPLRLHRRRLAGELADIRAGELAFTETEAGKLLAANGIHLTAAQLAALLDRTLGWAAGLRLAVLSLDPGDIDGAIDRFRGSDGLVAEYLIEELLDRVPTADRQFLLAASVAERINPELADVLTGHTDSHLRLARLVDRNALVVELAGRSGWFGFHPMFRDLLLHRLHLEQPDTAAILHGRAARWFGARGDAVPAIRHAGRAQDWELVGHLLAAVAWPLALTASGPALAAALEPAMTVAIQQPTAPTLLAAAVIHFQRHDFSSMRRDCDDAAGLTADVPAADRVAVDCLIGTLRIAHSRIVDPADTEAAAMAQLALLDRSAPAPFPTAEHHRVIAANNYAVSQLWAGKLEKAATHLAAVGARCRELGLDLTDLNVQGHLAMVDVIHGRLAATAERAGAAWDLAERRGWTSEPQALGLRAALALVDVERGRPAFPAGMDVDEWVDNGRGTDVACLLVLAIAAVADSAAGRDGALADEAVLALDAIRVSAGRLPPLLDGWCTAAAGSADIAAGRYGAAIDRIRAAATASAYPEALGRIVIARAQLRLDRPQLAMDALHPLVSAAPHFRGPAVEARLLAAVAADRLHLDTKAISAMADAIDLADQVGLVRPFFSAGRRVAGLLEQYRQIVGRHLEFTGKLIAALHAEPPTRSSDTSIPEQLTGREKAVLVYLPTMLKSAEIAADLYLSVNTVKTHQRAIYRKLGVSNRRSAVMRARELNILIQAERSDPAGPRRTPW
jgi:LuxR family maltose regulon positive regulatory protein